MNHSEQESVILKKNEVLCLEGDLDIDLYFVEKGNLLVCVAKGTQISPLAYIGAKEFIGEMSFFDKRPRSANIIALEDCLLTKIPAEVIFNTLPRWLISMGRAMATRIRITDESIRTHGLKFSHAESIKPLSMNDQRALYLALVKKQKEGV